MTGADLTRLRRVVYDTLAAEGRAPSLREMARRAGCTPDEAGQGLAELAGQHALVLTPDGDAVRMAHPFSAAPMAFVVPRWTGPTTGAGGAAARGTRSGSAPR